jgi:hypothetical protein
MFGFGKDKPKLSAIHAFENDLRSAVIAARLGNANRLAMIRCLEEHAQALKIAAATSYEPNRVYSANLPE